MDIGINVDLVTPRGTVQFNGYDQDAVNGFPGPTPGYLRLSSFDGIEFPGLSTPIQQRAQFDGDILFDFFRRGRYPSLQGQVVAPDRADRQTILHDLRDRLNSIVRADGTLRWIPPSDFDNEILALAPTEYFKLDEPSGSTVAVDSSGNGFNGTYSGTPTIGVAPLLRGSLGKALLLDATAEGITGTASTPSGGVTESMGFWLNGASGQAGSTILWSK